jgi:hypothetical protein
MLNAVGDNSDRPAHSLVEPQLGIGIIRSLVGRTEVDCGQKLLRKPGSQESVCLDGADMIVAEYKAT